MMPRKDFSRSYMINLPLKLQLEFQWHFRWISGLYLPLVLKKAASKAADNFIASKILIYDFYNKWLKIK